MLTPHALEHKPLVVLITDRHSNAIQQAVAAYAARAGWMLDSTMAVAAERYPVPHADGIVAAYVISARTRAWLRAHRTIPQVHIWMAEPDIRRGWSGVAEDSAAVGRLAAEYFLGLGFAHFAFYQKWRGPRSDLRGAAFLEALRGHGHRGHNLVFEEGRRGRRNHIAWLAGQLQQLPHPLALFVQDDLRGTESVYACRLAGLAVPDEVAILGVGNDDLMTCSSGIPLSSVDVQAAAMAQAACAMLTARLARPTRRPQVQHIAPAGVVARSSSDTRAVSAPTVARALRHIREHLAEALTPDAVARATGCTRRWLDHECRLHLGHPCAVEIARQRIARAIQLLHDTPDALEAIALAVGYANPPRFFRQFKRLTGLTPAAHRRG